ncbi:hypothetical protein Dimus_003415 [Dionaea muscipula]
MVEVAVVTDGLASLLVAGGGAVHGLGGGFAYGFDGGSATVAGGAPLVCRSLVSTGIEIPGVVSSSVAAEPVSRRESPFCQFPTASSHLGVNSNSVPVPVSSCAAVDGIVPAVPGVVPAIRGAVPGAISRSLAPVPVSRPVLPGRSSSSRSDEATTKSIVGKGKVGPSRSYAAVTVSDMKSDVKLAFVPPVNSNGKKHVVLYPWLPPRSGVCLELGHEPSSCAACRSSAVEVRVPPSSIHRDSQSTAQALAGSILMPHAGVRGTPSPSLGSRSQPLAPRVSEGTEGGGALEGQTPSVVLGDFNVIRTIEEKFGGGSAPRGMREFGQCILRRDMRIFVLGGASLPGQTTSKNKSRISVLTDDSGSRTTDPLKIKECFVDFYQGLLGSTHERRYYGYGSLDSFIRTRLSDTQQEELCRDVTAEEVSAVFKRLRKDKAPGPDGGDVESIDAVRATLSDFHDLSGLAPSLAKSSVFFSVDLALIKVRQPDLKSSRDGSSLTMAEDIHDKSLVLPASLGCEVALGQSMVSVVHSDADCSELMVANLPENHSAASVIFGAPAKRYVGGEELQRTAEGPVDVLSSPHLMVSVPSFPRISRLRDAAAVERGCDDVMDLLPVVSIQSASGDVTSVNFVYPSPRADSVDNVPLMLFGCDVHLVEGGMVSEEGPASVAQGRHRGLRPLMDGGALPVAGEPTSVIGRGGSVPRCRGGPPPEVVVLDNVDREGGDGGGGQLGRTYVHVVLSHRLADASLVVVHLPMTETLSPWRVDGDAERLGILFGGLFPAGSLPFGHVRLLSLDRG